MAERIAQQKQVSPMSNANIFIQDVTLRDGMHAVRHRITPEDVRPDRRGARRSRRRRHRGRPRRRPRRRLAELRPGTHTDWEWIEAAAADHHPTPG